MTLSIAERTKFLGEGVLVCIKCEEPKQVKNFVPISNSSIGYQPRCRQCLTEDRLKYHLEGTYGITVEEFRKMEAEQEGKCLLCGEGPEAGGMRLNIRMHPKTNKLQALLCTNCIHGLGKFGNRPELLRRAADFVEEQ